MKPRRNVSRAEWIALAVAGIFAIEVLIACWWLASSLFRIGP